MIIEIKYQLYYFILVFLIKGREGLGTEVYKIKKQYQSFFTNDLNTLATDKRDNENLIKVQEISPYPIDYLVLWLVTHHGGVNILIYQKMYIETHSK